MILTETFSELCVRALTISALAVMIELSDSAICQTSGQIPRGPTSHQRFITTADWYKPPSENLGRTRAEIDHDLIKGVPSHLHRESIALLGDAAVIDLTKEQAKHFGFQAEPDSILRTLIQNKAKGLRQLHAWLADVKEGRTPYSPSQAKKVVENQQSSVKRDNAEIKQCQQWIGQLKPYLIKSVTLQNTGEPRGVGGTEGFDGYLTARDLVIVFGTVGTQPVIMVRMPVVAYLPMKPRHVYTRLSMMD